jgi:hypothetical protein
MNKWKLITGLIAGVFVVGVGTIWSLNSGGNKTGQIPNPNAQTQGTQATPDVMSSAEKVSPAKAVSMEDVCVYFPKELIQNTIGKAVVKTNATKYTSGNGCEYYTEYRDDYYYAPGGNTPGGREVVAVLENGDVAAYKADKQTRGNTITTDPSIPMENIVVKNAGGIIWHVGLILGPSQYLRMNYIQDAVTGQELVKIAAAFAKKLKSGN